MRIDSKKFTNTWNAVHCDGSWRFVQCNWGARHLVMNSANKNAAGAAENTHDKEQDAG